MDLDLSSGDVDPCDEQPDPALAQDMLSGLELDIAAKAHMTAERYRQLRRMVQNGQITVDEAVKYMNEQMAGGL
jgi:polyhydroxyalkanoate synthesis regulator phasin